MTLLGGHFKFSKKDLSSNKGRKKKKKKKHVSYSLLLCGWKFYVCNGLYIAIAHEVGVLSRFLANYDKNHWKI